MHVHLSLLTTWRSHHRHSLVGTPLFQVRVARGMGPISGSPGTVGRLEPLLDAY